MQHSAALRGEDTGCRSVMPHGLRHGLGRLEEDGAGWGVIRRAEEGFRHAGGLTRPTRRNRRLFH